MVEKALLPLDNEGREAFTMSGMKITYFNKEKDSLWKWREWKYKVLQLLGEMLKIFLGRGSVGAFMSWQGFAWTVLLVRSSSSSS